MKKDLLAPNGKPSNLTAEQYKLVRTPAFKKWFGDWENEPANASKVIDENGEPLVVYHGSPNNFSVFDKTKQGTNTDEGIFGNGFYFSTDLEYAKTYSNRGYSKGYVKYFFLNIKNPLFVNVITQGEFIFDGGNFNQFGSHNKYYDKEKGYLDKKDVKAENLKYVKNINDYLNKNKYDGVIVTIEDIKEEYVALESNQIKLADGTNTAFDKYNNDIRFDKGGMIEDLINKGIVELKFYETTTEHAREYGLISKKPIYLQTIFVSENSRLKGVGKQVLDYLENYAKKNGNDLIFGHINNKAQFTKDDRETFFSDVDMIRYWLHNNGYAINEDNNDFHKLIIPNENIRFAKGGLLAPNGKPSNLTAEQYKLVRTPAFKKWFGDWENDHANASKVIDENGEPLVVYHYSNAKNIKEFYPFAQDLLNGNKSKKQVEDIISKWKNSKSISMMDFSSGTYFTPKKGAYSNYGEIEYACFLKGEFIFNTGEFNKGEKYIGNPSMKSPIWYYWNDIVPEIIVLYPNQIKLADGTNTAFDKDNNDIRFDKGGIADSGTPNYLKFLIG